MKLDKLLQRIALICLAASFMTGCSGYKQLWPASQPLPGTKTKGVCIRYNRRLCGGYGHGRTAGDDSIGWQRRWWRNRRLLFPSMKVLLKSWALLASVWLLSVKTSKLFYLVIAFSTAHRPKLTQLYYPVLDGLADMIAHFNKTTVKVAGYTDDQHDKLEGLALSREQAQTIANYLMRHHVDARIIYSIGYGERFAVSSNLTAKGRSDNRRVEITLRRMPDGALV